MKKIVLFHRDFRGFTGGHLKVWDYFNHVAASPGHEPRIAFSSGSQWDATNPWFGSVSFASEWQPQQADLLFLAGTDWHVLQANDRQRYRKPIINLIQHTRHAEPESELRSFLKHRAVRICVSPEVADAITATGEVNGPVFVVPNGIDLWAMPPASTTRATDIVIGGLKAPELAHDIHQVLEQHVPAIVCLTDQLPRPEYLGHLSATKIAVVLPRPQEGFFLPALEAMACGALVVCPDCVGNRGFCHDAVNCFRPNYDRDAIVAAVLAAVRLTEREQATMHERANETVHRHSLAAERENFHHILMQAIDLFRKDCR